MNDHWDLLYDNGKVYCYRSWTGLCAFIADVSADGHIGRVLVCQDRNQYNGSVDEGVEDCLSIIPGYFQHDQAYYER